MRIKRFFVVTACLSFVVVLAVGCSPHQYQLATSVVPTGGGTISPPTGTFNAGSKVTLVADQPQYYRFVGWAGDASGNTNPLTIVMNSNKQIVAQFAKIQYSVQMECSPSDGGTLRPGSGSYDAGTTINIAATPNSGYRFDHWSGDAFGSTNPLSVPPDRNMVITGNFIKQYPLSVSVDSNMGTANPNGGIYDAGTPVNLTAQALFPYAFQKWNGADNENANPTKVTMNSDKPVSVSFVKLTKITQFGPKSGNTYGNAIVSIDLNQSEWVEGTIDCDVALPAQAVYIQGPDGQKLKDLGRPGHATFQFQASVAGRYDVVIQANGISTWGTNYSISGKVYGFQ